MLDGSSDSMIDIQIEESLVRGTLMTIDSAKAGEDVLTIAGFLAVLVLSLLTGIFGPPPAAVLEGAGFPRNETRAQRLSFAGADVSSLNRFVAFSVRLVRAPPYAAAQSVRETVSVAVECKRDGAGQ